jgi:peptidoglycan hydrolase-like protein with peptidoglycan-binding domain
MSLLKLNSTGPEVCILQHRLTKAGFELIEDGDFGSKTEKAVIAFQKEHGLVVDGVVGDKTTAKLLNKSTDHWLNQSDLEAAATDLGVDMASIHAIKAVESRGLGFLADGRPKILYERHVMVRNLQKNGFKPNQIGMAKTRYPNLVNTAAGGYKGNAAEHYRLKLAGDIHVQSALESASWGLFQIMGYHWKALGYKSVQEFAERMRRNEGEHWKAFVKFVQADSKLHGALKDKNWAEFAKRYNGSNYKKNKYDVRLKKAHDEYVPVIG